MVENMFEISPDGKTLKVVVNGGYQKTMVVPDNPSYVMKDGKLMTKDLQEQVFPVVD